MGNSVFFKYPLARRPIFLIYYAPVATERVNREKATLFFENRELEIKENYNSYTRRIGRRDPFRDEEASFLLSVYGRTTDALASGGDEGRGRLRQATGSRQQALIRGFPNGATRRESYPVTCG